MEYGLTEEQEALRDSVRALAQRVAPRERAREQDRAKEFPHDAWEALASAGLLGLPFPTEYGGQGGGIVESVLTTEELARQSVGAAFAFLITVCFGGMTIRHSGTEAQKRDYLPRIAAGEVKLAGAFTEPTGGSDLFSLQSKAKLDGTDWIISGQKVFITGAHVADDLILIARTSPAGERRSSGLTVFLVPTDAPGVEIRRIDVLGMRSPGTTEIFLDGVRVPGDRVVGDVGDGWQVLIPVLNSERMLAAAWALGNGQAALDDALDYARHRDAFGGPIGRFQAIQHYIADMAIELEAARQLLRYAAWSHDKAQPDAARLSMMAKVACTEAGFAASHTGMRILAGAGYLDESDMQRYFRDAHVALLGPSTNEISKNFIATSLGLPRADART